MIEVKVGGRFRKQDEAKREEPGEHDAHDGIFLNAAVGLYPSGRDRAEKPAGKRPDGERDAGDVSEHHAGQDRMRNRVAHQ